MQNVILVGMGGFFGSVLRYLVNLGMHRVSGGHWFPFGTLFINFIGCFLIGFFGKSMAVNPSFSESWRLFICVGLLGGFTTYSAFGYETVNMLRAGQSGASFMNVAAHIMLCLWAVWMGLNFIK